MRILGVDPGINGAAALLTSRAALIPRLEVFDIPTREVGDRRHIDARAWQKLLRELAPDVCYFELTWAMPSNPIKAGKGMKGQGTVAAGRTQRIHGVTEAVVWTEIAADPVYITPQVWKRFFGLKGGEENKAASRDLIVDLFPECLRFFKRVKDTDRAEAALIAVYGAVRHELIELKAAVDDGETIEF